MSRRSDVHSDGAGPCRLRSRCGAGLAALALLLGVAAAAGAHEAGDAEPLDTPAAEAAPERPALFEPPAPGTYELPAIERVSDHVLLDPDGGRAPLLALDEGECALVSFVYTHCSDGSGCPAALALFQRLDREIARRPALAGRTRLVTASFDPAADTPERMAALRASLSPRSDWRFRTAAGPGEMEPVLEDFGQDVLRLRDAADRETDRLRHVLKVFLVDSGGAVRNVYSAGFLDWRIVLNDVATVLGEGGGAPYSADAPRPGVSSR